MRNVKTVFRALFLALALCVLMGAAALGDTAEFTFSLNSAGDGYVVTGYNGSSASVTVPDWYNEKPVIEIGAGAFQGNTTITSVYMPSTIVKIGEAAFKNCTKLSLIDEYQAASEPPVPDHIAGDVNDSGETDVYDALLVMQYDAGWNVTINKTNADVDANSGVDLDDAILILQYSAGEDVTLK